VDILTGLAAAGFTEYEARVYMALLRDYPATGYQISCRLTCCSTNTSKSIAA
jgi:sugar-specific transcriptional regulator TrmB